MGLRLGRRETTGSASKVGAFLWCGFICAFSLCAVCRSSLCCSAHLGLRSLRRPSYVQATPAVAGNARRELAGGPGSFPPHCTAKCGNCRPCNPVHVAVPPGMTPVITEYYPEAWRCKCGNKLYLP